MKITADTNVLVRALVRDDPQQAAVASAALQEAEAIAVPLVVLCELAWVLRRVYEFSSAEIAAAIRALATTDKVSTNASGVEAGLAVLEAGGDFADGVIAFEGAWLGASQFVSFDKKAVALLNEQGQSARLL